jgi:hypothetical protein
MKRSILFTLTLLSLVIKTQSWAIVKYADEEIERDMNRIYNEYELVRELHAKLDSSQFTYVIRYRNIESHSDGLFETDGNVLYLSFKQEALFYSLQARFAHEATHALQFEAGKIAFFKTQGEWKATNIDLWDEAEAFQMMIPVATASDFYHRKTSGKLYKFKKALEDNGMISAIKLLEKSYPTLSKQRKNNPRFGEPTTKNDKYFFNLYSVTLAENSDVANNN